MSYGHIYTPFMKGDQAIDIMSADPTNINFGRRFSWNTNVYEDALTDEAETGDGIYRWEDSKVGDLNLIQSVSANRPVLQNGYIDNGGVNDKFMQFDDAGAFNVLDFKGFTIVVRGDFRSAISAVFFSEIPSNGGYLAVFIDGLTSNRLSIVGRATGGGAASYNLRGENYIATADDVLFLIKRPFGFGGDKAIFYQNKTKLTYNAAVDGLDAHSDREAEQRFGYNYFNQSSLMQGKIKHIDYFKDKHIWTESEINSHTDYLKSLP